jgi:hypothetical protein
LPSMMLPRFVQNLAVTPLVSVGLEEARIEESLSQFLPPVT